MNGANHDLIPVDYVPAEVTIMLSQNRLRLCPIVKYDYPETDKPRQPKPNEKIPSWKELRAPQIDLPVLLNRNSQKLALYLGFIPSGILMPFIKVMEIDEEKGRMWDVISLKEALRLSAAENLRWYTTLTNVPGDFSLKPATDRSEYHFDDKYNSHGKLTFLYDQEGRLVILGNALPKGMLNLLRTSGFQVTLTQ